MALSGTLSTNSYQGRYIELSWSATQSIDNNSSKISWTLKGAGTASSSWYMAGGFKVIIDDSEVYSVSTDDRIKLYDGTVIASDTKTLYHDTDGTKSFSIYIEAGIYSYAINCTGEDSFTLDTIPRASTFGTITGDTIGSDMTVNITRYSSSFTNELWYRLGASGWKLVGTGIATSKTFTLPMSLCNQIPNATSGTLELSIVTYNGSTKIGEKTTTTKVKVPSSVVPSVTLSVSEAVANVKNKVGVYVKDLSKLSVSANGTGAYGSSISSYSVSANGTTYTSKSFTTETLKTSGTLTVSVTVKDSRGRTATKSTSITVYDYYKPKFNSASVIRSDSGGTASDDGTYLKASYNTSIASINSKNKATYTIKYKKVTDSSYTTYTIASDTSAVISGSTLIQGMDINSSYDVKIIITDLFYTTERVFTLSTAFTLMNFNASGHGLAIGKVSEHNNFEIDLPITINKMIASKCNDIAFYHLREDTTGAVSFGVGSGGVNRGVYDSTLGQWVLYRNNLTENTNVINGDTTVIGNIKANNYITSTSRAYAKGTSSSLPSADISAIPNGANMRIDVGIPIDKNSTPTKAWFSINVKKGSTSTDYLYNVGGFYYSSSYYASIFVNVNQSRVTINSGWSKVVGAGSNIELKSTNTEIYVYTDNL